MMMIISFDAKKISRSSRDILEIAIFSRYSQDILEIFSRYSRDFLEIISRYSRDILEIIYLEIISRFISRLISRILSRDIISRYSRDWS
jgi:hypothetical protein